MPTQPAILGTARLANFRLGYEPATLADVRSTRVRILLAGVSGRVRRAGLTVHDDLNDNPNTSSLTVESPAPTVAQHLRITINSDTPRLLFDGALLTVHESFQGDPPLPEYPCTAIDDGGQANRRQPFGTWTNISATTIAQYLITTFAPGFSTAGIAASLPAVSLNLDGSEGLNGAFKQLAALIGGGFFNFEDNVAYLFLTDTTNAPDDIDDSGGRFLDDPHIAMTSDASQLKTRVFGKGHGEPTLGIAAAGTAIVAVANADVWFNASGGHAISDTQVFAYTGVQAGGGGALVGPGSYPSAAPVATLQTGGSIEAGAHIYAYTDVTGAGESLPSPGATILTIGAGGLGTLTPSYASDAAGTIPSANHWWAVTCLNTLGETALPIAFGAPLSINAAGSTRQYTLNIPLGPAGTLKRRLYRGTGTTSPTSYNLVVEIADNTTTSYTDNTASPGAAAPTTDTTPGQTVALTAIAVGGSGTTSRKVYRTVAGGSQLKLLATIADNTTTTYSDTAADASLGANVPTVDASGLAQPSGQAIAGSPTLVVAGTAPFSGTGGLAVIGNGEQLISYTGKTATTLTGIPTSGPGSIVASISYNSTVTAAAALTGVTGITVPLVKGAPVNIWVVRNDATAQTAQAVIDAANGISPADGIYEAPPIVDERRNEASLTALCDATLALYSTPIVTVTYATKDVKTKSGKRVHVNIANPPIGPIDLTIQSVEITQIDQSAGTPPTYGVTASNRAGVTIASLLRTVLAAM